MPKRHMPAFGDLDEPELLDLADTLRHVLRMVHFGLDDPDYNFVIRSAPIGVSDFHWYLAIVPRLARAAGFELGSGMYINAIDPDDAAEHLRRAPVPEG
jgi:UDPglucose--hexose-1-phosphate uridylyltransferase